jgi:type II secretory pathway component GspD/PulD (secretin)
MMKNLYFSNVDAQAAKQVIESLIKPEKLIVNRKTNSLIVTDSIRNIILIEKLAQFIDKREGEVEIEVEIMEVDQKKIKEYGTELSSYQMGAEIEGYSQGKRLNNLFHLGADDIIISMPKIIWKLFSSITNTKILARPRIRGLDREKIEIKLGEKRPILRTTFVPVSNGGQDQQPISAYDLKDVGVSISITPTIHHNREVSLDLNFELTYVTDLGGAYMPPTLGNRKVTTKLRLGDNETGIIAGLTRGSNTDSTDGIPVLSSIPILKEVLSSRGKTRERTDILISITPRILRMPEITREDLAAYLIGTRQNIELKKWKKSESNQNK